MAPPKDTRGNTGTAFAGVGAHQSHVQQGIIGRALSCSECHRLPASFSDPSHLDGDGQAELTFGPLAQTGGLTPQYDRATATCTNTYCHSGGRWGHGGPVVWTAVGSGVGACGTCHGMPPEPATGHMVTTGMTCAVCHANVVNAQLQIINRDLHMNGTTDF